MPNQPAHEYRISQKQAEGKHQLPPWLYYPGMICMVLGNFAIIYANILGARLGGYPDLLGAILLAPIYWVMMSIAALKAAAQLVRLPNFWEKTTHGLDQQPGAEGSLAVE